MIISCRHRAILLRLAESPNAYPWHVDDSAEADGHGGNREPDQDLKQTIVSLKTRHDITKIKKPMTLNQMQSMNVQIKLEQHSEEDEEDKDSEKGKPNNADKKRKK